MSGRKPDDLGLQATLPISGEAEPQNGAPLFTAGRRIGGRYLVTQYIARGGMGEVYEVEDEELREQVALKTILETSPAVEARFKREIQLARKVTHRNVCRIFDVGYEMTGARRVVFLTMELLRGETLLERIRRDGPLPIPEASSLVRQLVAGLSAAHGASIVHGDFKSANVMLVSRKHDRRAAITDFGLARHGTDVQDGEVLCTPAYMAPEQVDGGAITPSTDIYALGIVLYEMMTGELPFSGASLLELAAKRLTEPAPSPTLRRPDLPPRWERAILACLEREPGRRPTEARQLLALLGLDTDSIDGIDSTQRVPPTRRVPIVRPTIALLVLVVLALYVERWHAHRTTEPASTRTTTAKDATTNAPHEVAFTPPRKPETLRAMSKAIDLFGRTDWTQAREELEHVVRAEPDFARGHTVYALVAHRLGDQKRAEEEATKAMALAARLAAQERAFTEGVAATILGQGAQATERLTRLHAEAPLDTEVALRLVDALRAAGREKDALTLIAAERARKPPAYVVHELEVLESEVAENIGDEERALAARRRAEAFAPALGPVAWMRDRIAGCTILVALDRTDEARAACLDARALAASTGERRLRSQASNELAAIDFSSGRYGEAQSAWEALVTSAHELGERSLEVAALSGLGAVANQAGDLATARAKWKEALEVAELLGNELAGDEARQSLAALEAADGNLRAALALVERVERSYRHDARLESYLGGICAVADMHFELGHDAEVEAQLAKARLVTTHAAKAPKVETCELVEAAVARSQGHPELAVASLRQALDRRTRAADRGDLEALRLELSSALEDAGDIPGALEQLDALASDQGTSEDSMLSTRLRRIRLTHPADARAELEALTPAVSTESLRYVRALARLELASATKAVDARAADRELDALAHDAKANGWVRLGLEAERRKKK